VSSATSWTYVTGGTLAPDAPSYVERQADRDLLESLQNGETCYVLNSRQMGKSSLCVRTIGRLRVDGTRTAFLDLTKFGGRNLTAEQWYAALLSEVGRELGMRSELVSYWKENANLPPVQRLFGAITELGLTENSPLVVFVDEIDVTLSLPFSADEFFAAIRQSYVGRASDYRLKQLTFCLLGTATPADLIQDTRVSPFNIGKRIELRDFTPTEAKVFGAGLSNPAALSRVMHWTHGHPYLTQRLCRSAQEAGAATVAEIDRLCTGLFLNHSAQESDDNLAFVRNRLLKSEADLPALLDLYRQMRGGKPISDDETNPLCGILKLSGVAKLDHGKLLVRNRIYEHVFDRDWVEMHMPDAEKRRQAAAYRKGVIRTLGFATVAVIAIGGLAVFGFDSAAKAREAEAETKAISDVNVRNLYIAKLNNIQLFAQEGNTVQMAQLLQETESSPHRGWEWGYWNGVLHSAKEEYQIDSPDRNRVLYPYFSADGKRILLGDQNFGIAVVVDRATRKSLGQYKVGRDEKIFATSTGWITGEDRPTAPVRDLLTGKVLFHLIVPKAVTRSITTFAGTDLIATIDYFSDYTYQSHLWNVDTGRPVTVGPGIGFNFNRTKILDASRRGNRILVTQPRLRRTSEDQDDLQISVIDRTSGKVIDTWATQSQNAPLGISATGRYVSVLASGSLAIRDVDQHRVTRMFATENGATPRQTLFNESDSFVIYSSGEKIVARSLETGEVITELRGGGSFDYNDATDEITVDGPTARILPLRGQKSASTLASGFQVARYYQGGFFVEQDDGTLARYEEFSLKARSVTTPIPITSLFTANGRLSYDYVHPKNGRKAAITDLATGHQLQTSLNGWNAVAAASTKDVYVALALDRKTLSMFQFSSVEPLWTMKFGEEQRAGIQISTDGRRVLSGSASGLSVIDGRSGKVIKEFRSQTKAINLFGLLATSQDLWTLTESQLTIYGTKYLRQKQSLDLGFQSVGGCDLSPDGRRIVTADSGGTFTIWDTTTQQRLTRVTASKTDLQNAWFTADGLKIVTCDMDRNVRYWSAETVDRTIKVPVKSNNP